MKLSSLMRRVLIVACFLITGICTASENHFIALGKKGLIAEYFGKQEEPINGVKTVYLVAVKSMGRVIAERNYVTPVGKLLFEEENLKVILRDDRIDYIPLHQ